MKYTLCALSLFFSFELSAQDCIDCTNQKTLSPTESEWPVELTPVEKIDYPRNSQAIFCIRPFEMVDTIVLHHSETPSSNTPENINELHLQRGTPEDPWYMIAYSYVINSPYPGETTPRTRVTEGRPMNLVGAHAGSKVFVPMDSIQQKIWDEGQITCGRQDGEFKVDQTLLQEGKIKANVTTLGLVVIGNYSPFSSTNPNGYSPRNPRIPTKSTQDLVAKMSCQLQKKYPRIKNIKWHNYYHATSCPGTIKNVISQIKVLARKYGCEFL